MKASMTQEDPRVTPLPAPHRASWRAAQDEIARAASELSRLRAEKEVDRALLAAQDARLAKAGADLEECKKLASGLITDICVEKEARAVAERIARERAAEVQRLEARVRELEPLAEVGRRMERAASLAAKLLGRLHPRQHRWIEPDCADCRMSVGAPPLPDTQPCIFHGLEAALRAAGIGEEVGHG